MKFSKKLSSQLNKIFNSLYNRFGPQYWWPAEGENKKLEIIIGAILTQNTAWSNVEKAITNLKVNKFLHIKIINEMNVNQLALLVKSSGYNRQKAERIKLLCNYIYRRYDGDIERLLDKPIEDLRSELLQIKGIGPETADSIILYAGEKPIFVVDAYTRRIFSRLGLTSEEAKYDELQYLFMKHLPHNTTLFNEFHALIVRLAKLYCKKKPLCDECPLSEMCKFQKK